MTQSSDPSPRPRTPSVATVKQRSLSGALGGLLGALVMSVIAAVLLTAAVTPVVAVTGYTATAAVKVFQDLPGHIDPGRQALPSNIYAMRDGERELIASIYMQNRVEVGWNDISQFIKDAAVAGEDPGFYSHGGVNVFSAARAALQNLVADDGPGASTITMQYVRNVLVQEAEAIVDPEESRAAYEEANARTTERKLREMRLAISVEKEFPKDEILMGYLNIALFGGQVYGIESAAQYYFNKSAKRVTLPEAASLVAIVNAPEALRIDIEENHDLHLIRRDYILDEMLKHGKITAEQHEEAVNTPIETDITPRVSGCSVNLDHGLGHFCNYVKLTIEQDPAFGETPAERMHTFSRGGFEVETTLDLDLQEQSFDDFTSLIPPQYSGFDGGGAATTVEPGTGRVLMMVQNRQFSEDSAVLDANPDLTSVNYNTEYEYGGSHGFQIGSTVKAFTLAAWLQEGHSLREVINTNGGTWEYSSFPAKCHGGVYGNGTFPAQNHLGIQWGQRTILDATALSINGAFLRMLQRVDLCDVRDLAENMGLVRASDADSTFDNNGTRRLTPSPSTFFSGTDEIAPLTLASAYAGFAAEGRVCDPTPIDRIFDADGNEVEFTKGECRQGLDPEVAAGVLYALEYNVTSSVGIGGHARSSTGVPHFAKTGTTDGYKDHWTAGGSTTAVTALWTGNVIGDADTEPSGMPFDGDVAFGRILNHADALYGGEKFPEPSRSALRQTMKTVPDTTGKSVQEAKSMLETLGFRVSEEGETDSAEPKGSVARTDPAGGSQASEGTEIKIYTSNGEQSRIPSGLPGMGAQAAVNALRNAGFTNIDPVCRGGSGRPTTNNEVVSVSPDGGESANPSRTVTLTIDCSSGSSDDD